jgi:hypothetical protein
MSQNSALYHGIYRRQKDVHCSIPRYKISVGQGMAQKPFLKNQESNILASAILLNGKSLPNQS